MVIADRLKALREEKNLSQGDIEKRTGLLRCYISRVENGHTVPTVETLEKFARALEVPLYQLFSDENDATKRYVPKQPSDDEDGWGASGEARRTLGPFRRLLARIDKDERELL